MARSPCIEVVRKQIDWAGSFDQNNRNGRGSPKMGIASKTLHALRTQPCNRNSLQEILDPPLMRTLLVQGHRHNFQRGGVVTTAREARKKF